MHDEEFINLTAFSYLQGHFEGSVMPFELKNAPQIFHKWMNKLFGHLPYVVVCVNVILVFSQNKNQHKIIYYMFLYIVCHLSYV